MQIRNANFHDAPFIHDIEVSCFPENQAASLETIKNRLRKYPQYFWLIEEQEEIYGFINGMVTDNPTIHDDMYKYPDLHNEAGAWQSVFGLAIAPAHQRKGYANTLIHHVMLICTQQNRKGIILTCEAHLIPFYGRLGFINEGLSKSMHGGDTFFDMRWTS